MMDKHTTARERTTSDTRWCILRSDQNQTSSGKVKFSYHLVCRSGLVWRTAQERKRLFNCFSAYLRNQESALCTLLDEHGEGKVPLDPSVYSNWQSLRTIFSTKLESSRRLNPVDFNGNTLQVTGEQILPILCSFLSWE